MIERICGIIHNYFTADTDKHTGEYVIENGSISLPFLLNGQYFRICGSALNDGIYQYPAADLSDEAFSGQIWAMKVPKAVKDIADEAENLLNSNGAALTSPYTSENVIGAYSYTKAAGASNGVYAWLFGSDGVYGSQLNRWRRISE